MKYGSTTAPFFTYLINYTPAAAHLKAYLLSEATSSGSNDVHSIWLLTRQNTLIYLQMVSTRSKGRKMRMLYKCTYKSSKYVPVQV